MHIRSESISVPFVRKFSTCLYACVLMLALLPFQPVSAQLFPKRYFLPQDGLAQKQVTTLFEDQRGALWVGTRGGISRFNGTEMISITVQQGLESNHIRSITEPVPGVILAFSNSGISEITQGKAAILCTRRFINTGKAFSDNYGYTYFRAESPEADLWIVGPDKSVVRFFFEHQFRSVPAMIWRNPENGEVLLLDDGGRYYWLSRGKVSPVHDFKSRPYLAYPRKYNPDLVWKYRNLFVDSGQAGFLPFEGEGFHRVFQPAVGIFECSEDAEKKLVLLNGRSREDLTYPDQIVNVMYRDNRMQVWIGTENGLVVFHHLLFRNYINRKLIPDPRTVLAASDDSVVYVGNYGAPMAEIHPTSGITAARLQLGNLSPADRRALEHFYYGAVNGFNGEVYFNTSDGVFTLTGRTLSRTVPLPALPVYSAVRDTVGKRLLFSVYRDGVYSWSPLGKLACLLGDRQPLQVPLYSMHFQSGKLYLGSVTDVTLVDSLGYRPFRDVSGDSVRGAFTITRDSMGDLWFGNDFGLFRYHLGRIVKLDHEFLNQPIRATRLINGNQLLIGSSQGIGVLFIDSLRSQNRVVVKWYDYRNGFETGEVQINGFTQDHEGKIWIASSGGVVRMDPDWVRMDTIPVMAEITEIQANGLRTGWSAVSPDSTGVFRMDHEMNQIRISFNSINTKTPMRDFYQYRLVGEDDMWSVPSQDHFAVFNNLMPGNYTFEVRIRNKDDLWNDHPTSISLQIIPAWYQKIWAQLAGLILALGMIIQVTILITRYKQRAKLLRITREHEIAELRLEAIRSQLEPHFVFNVLNSIGYAIRANETEMAYDHLAKFSSLMRKWLKSSEEPTLSLDAELELVREYLELEKFRFEERLNYAIEVDEAVPMDIRVPRMILQIPVENAVKHGISSLVEGGTVSIRIRMEEEKIRIRVEDNGIGRVAAAKRSVAGNRKGINLLEKMLRNISQFNQYLVTSEVIDLYDVDGKATGTAVEITIEFR